MRVMIVVCVRDIAGSGPFPLREWFRPEAEFLASREYKSGISTNDGNPDSTSQFSTTYKQSDGAARFARQMNSTPNSSYACHFF